MKQILKASIYLTISIYSLIILIHKHMNGNYLTKHSLRHTKVLHSNIKTRIKIPKYIDYNTIIQSTKHDTNVLQKYITNSIPIIITNIPTTYFEHLRTKYPIPITFSKDLIIKEYVLPFIGAALTYFIMKYIQKPIIYMASFSGRYKAGVAHIDSLSTYNFYYVQEGAKEVWIVPDKYTKYIDMSEGIDNVFVEKDGAELNNLEDWLYNKVPSYYHFKLQKGEVLLFNNANSIHKFSNVTGREEIYTIRLGSTNASELILRNDLCNWKQAEHYYNMVTSNTHIIRKLDFV